MGFDYEQLTNQRFQHLCQALLLDEFPWAQCLPVGQADGGRDAMLVVKTDKSRSKPLIVFQMKFHTRPLAEKRPHKWLIAKIKEELSSVERLQQLGAERYVLLTNVPGTAAIEAGSIDTLQSVLDERLPMPGQCWWRDDLDRRLERNLGIAWSYPEILSGGNALGLILTSALCEERERRDSTLRAYLAAQFRADEEVRFKQIDLQNTLIDLFIDN